MNWLATGRDFSYITNWRLRPLLRRPAEILPVVAIENWAVSQYLHHGLVIEVLAVPVVCAKGIFQCHGMATESLAVVVGRETVGCHCRDQVEAT